MNTFQKYPLNSASVDAIAEQVEQYLSQLKMERRNRLRIRLSIEEILLKWQEAFGEEAVCTFRSGVRFGRPFLALELPGKPMDPLECTDETEEWSRHMLGNIGLCPVYSYEKGKNILLLRLKKPKGNPLVSLLSCVALALAVGLLGRLALPEALISTLLEKLISPVYETFLGVLGSIAGPMVFLAVSWGIYSIGDLSVLGRIGKRMLGRYIGMTALMTAFAALVSLLMFRLGFSTGESSASQLWSILYLLLDIFPDNIISPLLEGNTMQIILMAVMIGAALLVLGKQTRAVAGLIEQINYVVQFLVELISRLVSFFIFIVLVQIIWSGSFGVVLHAWKPFLVFLVAAVLILAARFLRLAQLNGISPLKLIRKCAETFIVALATASSTAAFGTVSACCEKKLGIKSGLVSFGLPLGIVFYPPFCSIYFLIINFYMAECHGVQISLVWILICIFISTILAIASPPIPGGTLACYTVMFLQLGIPSEALAVALALDVLFDFMATALNMVLLELELNQQAVKLNMIDRSILQSPSRK